MKKSTIFICLLLLSTPLFSQCFKIKDLSVIFKMDFKAQDKYLTKKGYKLNTDSYSPESFGWDWNNEKTKLYVNVKMQGKDVYTVQYRLLANSACFNSLLQEAKISGFTQHYQKVTSSTTYTYYKSSKFGLETAEWMSGGEKYFQFNLGNLKYFDEIEHQWDNY